MSEISRDEELGQTRAELRELRRNEMWLNAQKEAFQAAVNGAPLETSLGFLTRTAQAETEGAARCGFWIADQAGVGLHHVVGLPQNYADRIAGFRIGHDSLACGLAVATGQPVITPDVRTDPRWEQWLWLASEFDYRAVWSFPVALNEKAASGTFAMYFPEPREPSIRELEIAAIMTQAAAIIISRHNEVRRRGQAEADLRDRENRLRILVAELQHRDRNILGVVRRVFGRTFLEVGDREDMELHFRDRLEALARTQATLIQTTEGTADLEDMIWDQLMSVGAQHDSTVHIGGPDVVLSTRIAHPLGLMLHELTTNALKYGALKAPGARLNITWTVQSRDGGTELDFVWQEIGVAAVSIAPRHEGFGRELIERALPHELGASTSFEIEPGGVICKVTLPLDQGAGSVMEADGNRE
jgi:two-component sensor histidine kinase